MPAEDFQSFPAKVMGNRSIQLAIPSEICHKLGIAHGSMLLVAIKKISVNEAMQLFGWKSKKDSKTVVCPKCGKTGTLITNLRGTPSQRYYVAHRKKHGFPKSIIHSVGRILKEP